MSQAMGRTTAARLGNELAECRAAIRELWAVVVEQDLELERLRERVQQARPARLKRSNAQAKRGPRDGGPEKG